METLKYESPKFEFEELELVERVAAVCWGLGHAYLDVDKDGQISDGDLQIDFGSGCNGAAAAEAINKWFLENLGQVTHYTPNVCNTQEPGLIASQS